MTKRNETQITQISIAFEVSARLCVKDINLEYAIVATKINLPHNLHSLLFIQTHVEWSV